MLKSMARFLSCLLGSKRFCSWLVGKLLFLSCLLGSKLISRCQSAKKEFLSCLLGSKPALLASLASGTFLSCLLGSKPWTNFTINTGFTVRIEGISLFTLFLRASFSGETKAFNRVSEKKGQKCGTAVAELNPYVEKAQTPVDESQSHFSI